MVKFLFFLSLLTSRMLFGSAADPLPPVACPPDLVEALLDPIWHFPPSPGFSFIDNGVNTPPPQESFQKLVVGRSNTITDSCRISLFYQGGSLKGVLRAIGPRQCVKQNAKNPFEFGPRFYFNVALEAPLHFDLNTNSLVLEEIQLTLQNENCENGDDTTPLPHFIAQPHFEDTQQQLRETLQTHFAKDNNGQHFIQLGVKTHLKAELVNRLLETPSSTLEAICTKIAMPQEDALLILSSELPTGGDGLDPLVFEALKTQTATTIQALASGSTVEHICHHLNIGPQGFRTVFFPFENNFQILYSKAFGP